jgi:hypothetical protein
MSNIEKRKSTGLANNQKNAFEAYGKAVTARAIEGVLLKFVQGEFLAGKDSQEIALGTRLIARMDTLEVGWVRWENNVPVDDDNMGLVAEGFVPVKRHELGDLDKELWETDGDGDPRDPWQFSNRLGLEDPESDEVYTFATSSKGGLTAVGQLCKYYGHAMRHHPDQDPIIELGADSYRHRDKAVGRVKVPVFKPVGLTNKKSSDDTETVPTEPPKPLPIDKAVAAAKPAQPAVKPQ